MTECEAARGEFFSYSEPEKALVAQHFRKIIANSGLASTASAIDVAAWDDLVVGPLRDHGNLANVASELRVAFQLQGLASTTKAREWTILGLISCVIWVNAVRHAVSAVAR